MRYFYILIMAAVVWGLYGCPTRPPQALLGKAPEVQTVDELFAVWAERASRAGSFEASVQVELRGAHLPFRGDLLGLVRVEKEHAPGTGEVGVHILAYLPFGAPGFEFIAIGDRFEMFVPGEDMIYLNAGEVAGTRHDLSMPLSDFNAVMFPPEVLIDLLSLLFGHRGGPDTTYTLDQSEVTITLSQYKQDKLTSVIDINKGTLLMEKVTVYQDGREWASGKITAGGATGAGAFIPGRIEIDQGDRGMSLKLNQIKASPGPLKKPIAFRSPGAGSVVWVSSDH